MTISFGETIYPDPDEGPRNDADHVYGQGWSAKRTPRGIVLRWDGGGIQSRMIEATISEAEFTSLRDDPSTFDKIYLRHDPNAQPDSTLGNGMSIPTPLEHVAEAPVPSREHVDLANALWYHTHDVKWQYEVERDMVTDDKAVFVHGLTTLAGMVDQESGPRLRPSFVQVLLRSHDRDVKKAAVNAIFGTYWLPTSPEFQQPAHQNLEHRMLDATPDTIDGLLAEAAALGAG